jgi:hypothetical protein
MIRVHDFFQKHLKTIIDVMKFWETFMSRPSLICFQWHNFLFQSFPPNSVLNSEYQWWGNWLGGSISESLSKQKNSVGCSVDSSAVVNTFNISHKISLLNIFEQFHLLDNFDGLKHRPPQRHLGSAVSKECRWEQ